jgi:hypothetical protein
MPADLFGNLKIPRFEALNSTADTAGCKLIPPVLKPSDLSSLTGLLFIDLPHEQETLFNIEYTYLSADCQLLISAPYSFW